MTEIPADIVDHCARALSTSQPWEDISDLLKEELIEMATAVLAASGYAERVAELEATLREIEAATRFTDIYRIARAALAKEPGQ